ncbi:MAG: hypothetical protein DMD66_00880 [Gemmatimonadetes bacterium]|nr:MAG: hypothetical protein DMD66_00880 [Gemmatimonadota bacterium]
MRRLKGARKSQLHHRGGDRNLHGDDRQQDRAAPRLARHPPNHGCQQCVSEHAMRPLNGGERTGGRDHLAVAERKAAARGRGSQIRGQGAEQHSDEGEAEQEPGAGKQDPRWARSREETRQQEHGRREMQNHQDRS